MNSCLFVSDLHGKMSRYEALFKVIKKEKPDFVFIGGDLLPHRRIQLTDAKTEEENFVHDFLIRKFTALKEKMDCEYPEVFLIPGNDDHKSLFEDVAEGENADLWRNLHNHCIVIGKYRFYGYACVPPTPFMIKDWERFDISVELAMGCIAPADGYHSMPPDHDPQQDTIQRDLQKLVNLDIVEFAVFLFHSPPYQTVFDQAEISMAGFKQPKPGLPVGSKAIRNLIDEKQPYITMHGHVHESVRLTGEWKQTFGRTCSFSAAHDGPELAVIKFELQDPFSATRRLIKT
jgi:uncharacterized protein